MSRAFRAKLVAFGAGALSLLACGLELPEGLAPDAKQLADDAVDSQDTIAIATAIAGVPALALTGQSLSLAEVVERQQELAAFFDKAECLSVETEGNTVSYVLDACTGPWGLVTVSGRETATFSPGPKANSFQVDMVSDGLEVNGKPAEHSATAVISLLDGKRVLELSGSYDGTALLGPREVHHDVDLTLEVLDSGSIRVDGTSSTRVGVRSLDLEVRDFEREGLRGTCPSGVVTAKRKLAGLTITLTFDGSDELLVESSRGGHDTFDLECEPAGG
ncbi:MAG: hypothetical protein JNK04_09375 [Myxococcales bacterium]|nr:hypothetical protein [Myxococcales bacterium]